IFDYWSPETFPIFGFDPSEGLPTLPKWLTVLHPDDRDLVAKTLERIFREGVRIDVTYRVEHPKQGKRIMHSTGEPVVEHGKVTRLIGNTLDITEQENAIRELKKAFGEIRALKDELYKENIVLRHEIGSTSMFQEVSAAERAQPIVALGDDLSAAKLSLQVLDQRLHDSSAQSIYNFSVARAVENVERAKIQPWQRKIDIVSDRSDYTLTTPKPIDPEHNPSRYDLFPTDSLKISGQFFKIRSTV